MSKVAESVTPADIRSAEIAERRLAEVTLRLVGMQVRHMAWGHVPDVLLNPCRNFKMHFCVRPYELDIAFPGFRRTVQSPQLL